jgi:endonuclease YncB( thermonuclease family)
MRPQRRRRSHNVTRVRRKKQRFARPIAGGLVIGVLASIVGLHWSGSLQPTAPPPVSSAGRAVPGTYDPAEIEAHRAKTESEAANAQRKAQRRPTNVPAESDAPQPVYASSSLGVGCVDPQVVDGDTLRCGATRIRLHAIDAPEMNGHCRPGRQCVPGDPSASTEHLRALVSGSAVSCRQVDTDRYGRAVALCSAGGRDLSCAQVQSGHAFERYGTLNC